MWVVFGSEALHLMWLKMEYKEYKEKSQHKIKLLEEIIDRVEHGQAMDDNLKEEIRMVLLNGKRSVEPSDADIDEEYFNKLIASSEQAASEPVDQPTTTAETKPNVQPEPKSNWPPSDGRGEGKKKTFYL
ncbi:uncharacterized protein BYT42DRAFT_547984 [Radiomyces spectabilis]|uniref:uncharacterized protein n=1 Tax=Radiomyces spectabilis TaxID=64574 RepID=UPI0022208522|nr:uncharacterized protein BYT42DRAFT_547984 [Radiomyces spectabilis]KAI8372969.1 hypothetical protein BYT42DRAFT_547984 [Radiomyces spectabilis]